VLYLFGQVLVFVLVALVLGAALAWIFLIGPMRRQRASSAAATAGVEDRPGPATAGPEGDQADRPSRSGLAELDEDRLAALTDWLRRQEERSTVENAELVTRLAAAEQQVGESESRVSAAERQVATAVEQVGAAQARMAQIEAELRGVAADEQSRETRRLQTALAEAEARAARFSARLAIVRTEVEEAALQAAAVTERLDRRQAEWAAERAGLLVRIAEAESIAGAWAANRERGGLNAASVDIPAVSAPAGEPEGRTDDGPDGRTDVVDVATVDGVDLADRADLVDGADLFAPTAGRVVALGGTRPQGRPARTVPARQRTAHAALVPAGSAAGPADGGSNGTEPPTVDTAALDAVVQEILDADARAVPGPDREVLAPTPAAESVLVPEPAPAEVVASEPDELGPDAVSAEPVSAEPVVSEPVVSEPVVSEPVAFDAVVSEPVAPNPVVSEPVVSEPAAFDADEPVLPSWGGPAEPVPSTDNLKEIVGIGPVIEARLRTLGITSFRQLAAMGDTDVDRLSARLDGFGSRILSDDWVGQARELQTRGLEDLTY
jgi:predicted flap endonuclease-1-like 5' DNA nuclease